MYLYLLLEENEKASKRNLCENKKAVNLISSTNAILDLVSELVAKKIFSVAGNLAYVNQVFITLQKYLIIVE